MNKTLVLILATLVATVPFAGCIENMSDLKDRLGANTVEEPEPVEPAAVVPDEPDAPELPPAKPPVARITVFGANGALVYKSSFEAADPEENVFVKAPVTLQLLASESEALEPGATLVEYTWVLAGMKMTGSKVEHELTEPGLYPLTLTIKDSANGTDDHTITIAIVPESFDVVETIQTSQILGIGEGPADAQIATGAASYTLQLMRDDKAHKATSISFTTKGGDTCDPKLKVTAPDGRSVGPQDSGAQETISFTDAPEGAYVIEVTSWVCLAPTGIPIEVTATLVQIVEGMEDAGDGHAHAH